MKPFGDDATGVQFAAALNEWEEEFDRAGGWEEGEKLLGSCENDDVTQCFCEGGREESGKKGNCVNI